MSVLFAETAEIRPTDIKLRDYQLDAVQAIRHEFSGGKRSTLLILPTGCGKTLTASWAARQTALNGGRTLVLAHRSELIDQFHDALVRIGLESAIEKAELYARAIGDPHSVVATVQTLQRARLESWPKDYFKLIITDEAHHATAETYQRIYRHFKARHLGITATADRADQTYLGDVFESVAYELSLWDAMTAPAPGPYLSRLKFVQCDVGIDLRDIRTTGGDLNQADLEEAIRPHIEALANAIRQEVGSRKLLVFTPDVGSATAMSSALESIGITSRWVSGDHPDRKGVIAGFRRGDFQSMVNCALCTEGFDVPDISAVALCRPTKSRALYAQMAGRGTRLAPGKENCLLIDFNWLTEKHQLVKPVELFDANGQDSEVLDIAQEFIAKNPRSDLMEVVEQAREEQAKRTVLKIKAREREIRYRKVSYDPLSAMETLGVGVRREAKSIQGTATERQKSALSRFGITNPDSLSKPAAGRLLDQLIGRAKKDLASYKQVTWMIRNGIDPVEARAMSWKDAKQTLDRLWGKPA